MVGPLIEALFSVLFTGRRRPPIGNYHRADEREVLPMELAYRAWAEKHHLERTDGRGHVFTGMIAGREITFTTGLAGSSPLSPELLVAVELPIEAPHLVRRERAEDDPIASPLIESSQVVRAVGLTKSSVRVTLEKLTSADDLDRVLDVLDQSVRNLRGAERPYRG